jgi:putative ABC transport system ATP-binding protein
MREPLIELLQVGKRYPSPAPAEPVWAVRGVTLSIHAGDVTVLMGPSGSGKTTLLSMIGGLLAPTEGFLSVNGTLLDECDESQRQAFRRRNIGFVFQTYNLLASLTAAQNVKIALAMRGADTARVHDCLSEVGMAGKADSYPEHLSGGQRQRVAVARALAGSPPILLADEPTAALDAEQGRIVMALLRRRARERGTAVLVVTHDPRVRDYADRVIEMEDGRLNRIVKRLFVSKPKPTASKRAPRELLHA